MKFYNTYFHATGAELQQEVAQQHAAGRGLEDSGKNAV